MFAPISNARLWRLRVILTIGGLWLFAGIMQMGAKARAAELQTQEGTHLRLISDVQDADMLADLVSSFDAAVPQWLEFWGVPASKVNDWKVTGYLMRNVETFQRSGALPPNVPKFQFGFASPTTLWVHHQPTRHYNRHLILHEGVHALAIGLFGGGGPSWYMEGTAELLATHRDRKQANPTIHASGTGLLAQASNDFRINLIPRNREEAPFWGRFRVVEQRRREGTIPSLKSVMQLPMALAGDVESYTWCWAAAMLMTQTSETRAAFIQAAREGRDQSPAFTSKFFRAIREDWPVLQARWQLLMHELEYGFTWDQQTTRLSADDPRYDGRPLSLAVQANQSWQSAGAWFPKGTRLQLTAGGQCVLAQPNHAQPNHPSANSDSEPETITKVWISQPQGVRAVYHRGFPIGQLQLAIIPIQQPDSATSRPLQVLPAITFDDVTQRLAQDNAPLPPVADARKLLQDAQSDDTAAFTNASTPIHITEPSWLLFRIHDIPGELGVHHRADNQGQYLVQLMAR